MAREGPTPANLTEDMGQLVFYGSVGGVICLVAIAEGVGWTARWGRSRTSRLAFRQLGVEQNLLVRRGLRLGLVVWFLYSVRGCLEPDCAIMAPWVTLGPNSEFEMT